MATPDDWRELYPFASQFIDLSGVRLHYLDEGRGLPLLMVHGNPTWSFYWRNLVRRFRDRYRCVVPDHVGCGLSDKPEDYSYTLDQRIEDLLALIEGLDLQRITLLVHDWGGAIGLGAALRCPKRFERFVLFNTGAFPPPRIPWRILACRLPWLGTWAIRRWNLFARAALTMAMERPSRLTPAIQAGLLAPYDSWAHRVAVDHFVKDIPITRSHPTWLTLQRIEAGLPFLQPRPVRLIWGMRDWCFTSVCLERLQRLLPQAQACPLPQAGHYVIEDAVDDVLRLVEEFLEESSQDRPLDPARQDARP